MVTIEIVRKWALSFPDVEEKMHFEKPSFRVRNKIFATLWVPENRAVLKLSEEDQSVFTSYRDHIFSAVPGAWGRKGWTMVELKKVRQDMFRDALKQSYKIVAPKSLIGKIGG
jgi:predicted DNA-binding protein (MmcQ/YjbR family)